MRMFLFMVVAMIVAASITLAQDDRPSWDLPAAPQTPPAIRRPTLPTRPNAPPKAYPVASDPADLSPSLSPSRPNVRARQRAVVRVQQVYEEISAEEIAQKRKWRTLREQIRETSDEVRRKELGNELRSLLESMFDRDLERRDEELQDLETRVQNLRDAVERRRTNRDRIINVQVDSVLLDAQGLSFFDEIDLRAALPRVQNTPLTAPNTFPQEPRPFVEN